MSADQHDTAGPGGGATTIRVTATEDVILRHALELTDQVRGENRWQRQARGLGEIGYRIVPTRDDPSEYSPGTVGARWAELRAASDQVPSWAREELAQVIRDLEEYGPIADRLGWPAGPTFYAALDTLRALIGAPSGDDEDIDQEIEEGPSV